MSFGKSKDESERITPATSIGPTSLGAGPFSVAGAGQPQLEAFLGKGSKVVGSLNFSGPADLDGFVEGEITARERLTIGEAAVINAKISGAEIVVKGTVNGDIIASKRLSLKKPARVTGNIVASNLSIDEGVIFEGKCSMNASSTAGDSKIANVRPLEKAGASA